jgi:hypothetical protein
MTEVLVERYAPEPLTDWDLARMSEDGAGCLALHRVHWNRTLLSADGRELVCHYSGADLESIRMVLKAQGSLRAEIWSCTWRNAAGITNDDLGRANVFASWRFDEPVPLEELESIDTSASFCLQNHRVRFLRTFISSDRRRLFCLCQAADAESTRLALRDAERPVERVFAFRQFHP